MPSHQAPNHLQVLIDSARPFLRGDLDSIDKNLPSLVSVLRSAGGGECWHKLGTFFEHLFHVYRILKLWKAPDAVCLCGLFHSAYSNSYNSLAIFDRNTGRDVVRGHVGDAAERLIHLFCVVPRQTLIHDDLLFKYSEAELVEHLKISEASLKNAREKGLFDGEEPWRKKLNTLLPAGGIMAKHIKTGEEVLVTRRVMAVFILMTLADFSDHLFGYQDALFENVDGRLEVIGNNFAALWPGDFKPGLWINSVSRMSLVYTLILRDEEIHMEERKRRGGIAVDKERDEDIELVVPPVLENCTKILDSEDQIASRDLYWEAVVNCDTSKEGELERAEKLLMECIEKNPYVGEPHVVLGQIYLSKGKFEEGGREAERGLTLILEWGSPWDKRMSWEGWVAWARVLILKAEEKSWPHSIWGILKLGLVK